MPLVSLFLKRVTNGLDSKNADYKYRLSVTECVDLMFASTVTHAPSSTPVTAGTTWTPVSTHPPHAHAHISGEGFSPTKGKTAPKESEHLDPVTRAAYLGIHQERLIVDPQVTKKIAGTKTKVPEPYTQRKKHSQFEDSEVALMTLFFALNTETGQQALLHLETATSGGGFVARRAVLNSQSAAECLKKLPMLKDKKPSSHPLRGKTPGVLERGTGGAGAAPVTNQAIVGTVTVLDATATGDLLVTTHYPVSSWKTAPSASHDKVERSGDAFATDSVEKPWRTDQQLLWSPEKVCVKCEKLFVGTGFRWYYWHCCRKCGYQYCPSCGDKLKWAGWFTRERRCDQKSCDGVTFLF
ncbi:FYVE zinc finger domain-containing protein [Hyalangium gracile]|uniref:hypothetical protein n=1 Tax=Hyalangium gracile TaxID=394092 RepID=UPI001CCB81A1|nr:hypothetical protein [Hyalangium gracile]